MWSQVREAFGANLGAAGVAARLAVPLLVSGCLAHARAIPVDAAPRLAPTCRNAVHVFAARERVPEPYRDLAILRTVGNAFATDNTLVHSLQDKAAKLGANGLVYGMLKSGVALLVSPAGEAVAVYIPGDTARIAGECAAENMERAARVPAPPLGPLGGSGGP